MGFIEVLKHLPYIKQVMDSMVENVRKEKPDIVLLIDYPGFNLKFARMVKKYCKKIVYYISPQLWAWGKRRIKKIKTLIDKMIVIFPFEKEFYKKNGIDVDFVGHPLLEILDDFEYQKKEDFIDKYGFTVNSKLLAVFPGSRIQEVKKHLPIVNDVLIKLLNQNKINIGLAVTSTIPLEIYKQFISDDRIKLIKNDQYNLLKHADLALVKSGTTTVEAACFEVPMIIFYKTSFINFLIGRLLVKIDSFGMVNIIAGEKIVPELLQNEVNVSNLYNYCVQLLNNNQEIINIKNKLHKIRIELGTLQASKKTAEIIFNYC
jgi:lipid-A-disaccharide synthase